MEFRVLGPLEVLNDAKEALVLGSGQQCAVLALLILHSPEPLSADRIIDELWGERPPASASHAVQVYVSNLRKALPSGTIESTSSGYRLVAEPGRIDARRFEALVDQGRRAYDDGAFADAERTLGQALALWRGPALADFLSLEFADREAARLHELRFLAREACLESQLERGDCAGAVGGLEALVEEQPLREHTRWLLMRALDGAGRHADALTVYHAGRQRLGDELGLPPGPELRVLAETILRQADVASSSDARPPRPPALSGLSPDYRGRDEEHGEARELWDAAAAGRRQCLLVDGELGIGKTQFVLHIADELYAKGATVLFGRCPEELVAPYAAWIQALSPLVEHARKGSRIAGHLERHRHQLSRLLPALANGSSETQALGQRDPESERYLLFSAVVGLLACAAEVAPVVLVLDDLHWADPTTLALLRYVVAETDGARLLIVATYRHGDLGRDQPVKTLRGKTRVLEGLDTPDVLALARAAGVADADYIAAETRGNPFFVAEMLRHRTEFGDRRRTSAGAGDFKRLGVPERVREVVLERVRRLGDECYDALCSAAVIGRRFDCELLARVVRQDGDRLIGSLTDARDASLLEESPEQAGWFAFAHDLINHALCDALGPTRRAYVHARIAEALERLDAAERDARAEELARHWNSAIPRDAARVHAWSRLAGERALAKLAPEEALRWLALALDSLPRPDAIAECDLTTSLGEAQRQTGREEFRDTLLRAARMAEELGDASRMAAAALANNRGFTSTFGRVDAERLAVLERATEMNAGDDATRARLLSLQAMELQFDGHHRRRRRLANQALKLARDTGDRRSLPYVLRDHFHATWAVDTLDARRRSAEELGRLAKASDDRLAHIWAVDRKIHVAAESGRIAEARGLRDELLELTERLGQPGLRWHASYYAAGLAQLSGELEEAERLAEEAVVLGRDAAEPDADLIHVGQLCTIRSAQGRGEEVLDVLRVAAAEYPAVPAFEAALAVVLCDLGRGSEAAPRLDRHADRRFADIPRDQIYSTALALWARVAADVGARPAAERLYELIGRWQDRFVWNGASGYGAAEHYLAMLAATLGAHDRAHEHFAAASELHESQGVNVWEAQNLCSWAQSLLACGRTAEAGGTAERALALSRAHACGATEARAARLLEPAAVA